MALLVQAFPGLTPQESVQLLLRSSTDMGEPGVDVIWGQGQMNVVRAFQPFGTLRATSVAGGLEDIGAPMGETGPAFGDAIANAAGLEGAAFDDFGRAFSVDYAARWALPARLALARAAPNLWRAAVTPLMHGASVQFAPADPGLPVGLPAARAGLDADTPAFYVRLPLGEGLRLAVARGTSAIDFGSGDMLSPHLASAGGDLGFALEGALGDGWTATVAAEAGDYVPGFGFERGDRRAGAVSVAWQGRGLTARGAVGVSAEDGGVLGIVVDQRFGGGADSRGVFAGFGLAGRRGEWRRMSCNTEASRVRGEEGAAVGGRLALIASSASIRVEQDVDLGDGLAGRAFAALARPLRIERGALWIATPRANGYGLHSLRFDRRVIDAAPSGREIEAKFGLDMAGSGWLTARGELGARSQPGHRADGAAETFGSVGVPIAN